MKFLIQEPNRTLFKPLYKQFAGALVPYRKFSNGALGYPSNSMLLGKLQFINHLILIMYSPYSFTINHDCIFLSNGLSVIEFLFL